MGVRKNCVAVNKERPSATACASLCGLAGVQKVTSHLSPQTQACQKRVAGVRYPASSAQPKVAGEPGGRNYSRIKAGGRFGAPGQRTPPRRAGRGFSIGGRNFYFLLGQVVGNRKVREEIPWFQHSARWLSQVVFRDFAGISAGVIFHPLGSSRGSVSAQPLQSPYSRRVQAGICARICTNTEWIPQRSKC